MRVKGQLRYVDAGQTIVKFFFKKNDANAETKNIEAAKLPAGLIAKLKQKPTGIGIELPITDKNQIDLIELTQSQSPTPTLGRATNEVYVKREITHVADRIATLTDGSIETEKINVTDPSLGLQVGNEISPGAFLLRVTKFAANLDGLPGKTPDINLNPYNFVEFAANPWDDSTPDLTHANPMDKRLSGRIQYEMKALTPVFVPGGFPFGKAQDGPNSTERNEQIQSEPRHFFRMHTADAGNPSKYAIPGSSIKGMIRSEIEALSNSRLGVLLDEDFFDRPIPYRRRSFVAGLVGPHDGVAGQWKVQPVNVLYMHKDNWGPSPGVGTHQKYVVRAQPNKKSFAVRPTPEDSGFSTGEVRSYLGGLAVAQTRKPYVGIIVEPTGATVFLDDSIVEIYQTNLSHPHYERHRESERKAVKKFYGNLATSNIEGVKTGDLIYYTSEGGKIATFGKNINYLWPSSQTVCELIRGFQTPETLGLGNPLTMAERLFGFSGIHKKSANSHPFRGLLKFETAWGPPAEPFEVEREQWPELTVHTTSATKAATGWKIALAPLTSPQTRAKSRPLYLKPDGNMSGSWEDKTAQLRGRKFYWPQTDDTRPGKIWKFHLKDAAHASKQLPPPLHALKEETPFSGRIHFRNLTQVELGALVFALEGDTQRKTYDHTLRIGKGKPRGLGNVRCSITSIEIDSEPHLLLDGSGNSVPGEKLTYLDAFQAWVKLKCGEAKDFWQIPYIQSYRNLHHWKSGQQIRYYPINFSQYGWLPDSSVSNTSGEPKYKHGGTAPDRPPAMKLAKDLP